MLLQHLQSLFPVTGLQDPVFLSQNLLKYLTVHFRIINDQKLGRVSFFHLICILLLIPPGHYYIFMSLGHIHKSVCFGDCFFQSTVGKHSSTNAH